MTKSTGIKAANSRPGLQPCHNCRRKQLKCDRSIPQCLKCTQRGQECLGYQCLFRWEQGVASRGRMAGKTFDDMKEKIKSNKSSSCRVTLASFLTQQRPPGDSKASLQGYTVTDPIVRDLSYISRRYLSYCMLSFMTRMNAGARLTSFY